MTNKQYLLIPLGLSFDSLIEAAIVATKRENHGNTVHDTVNDREIDHKELLSIVRSSRKPKQKVKAPIQQGLFNGYYKILPLLIEGSYERDGETYFTDDDDELPLKSINFVKTLFPQLAQAAQKIYDDWDEEDQDTYAGGGICHLIADDFVSILYDHDVTCTSVSSSHEQHVYVALKVVEGVYTLDLHYSIYETGGGFSWKKIPNVKFDRNDISIYCVSRDPEDFKDQLDESMNNQSEPFAAFAIIFKDGKIAATTRTDGSIGLPGGKVDPGEDAIDCARRESEEEGFKVSGSGRIAHRDLVEGRPVVWVAFDDATMLTSYKEQHRGIKPIWTDVINVANKFGNRFLLNLKP